MPCRSMRKAITSSPGSTVDFIEHYNPDKACSTYRYHSPPCDFGAGAPYPEIIVFCKFRDAGSDVIQRLRGVVYSYYLAEAVYIAMRRIIPKD